MASPVLVTGGTGRLGSWSSRGYRTPVATFACSPGIIVPPRRARNSSPLTSGPAVVSNPR